jgi:hypothetical protein
MPKIFQNARLWLVNILCFLHTSAKTAAAHFFDLGVNFFDRLRIFFRSRAWIFSTSSVEFFEKSQFSLLDHQGNIIKMCILRICECAIVDDVEKIHARDRKNVPSRSKKFTPRLKKYTPAIEKIYAEIEIRFFTLMCIKP